MCVGDGGGDFLERISGFHRNGDDATRGEITQFGKQRSGLRSARSFIPLGNPKTTPRDILKDKLPVRYSQRLPRHRAIGDHDAAGRERVTQAHRAIAADGVEREPDRSATGGSFDFINELFTQYKFVDWIHVGI